MPCLLCSHTMPTGKTCGSPALAGQRLCYNHTPCAKFARRLRALPRDGQPLRLEPMGDREAIQIALGETLRALAAGRLAHRQASVLFLGLQIASTNIRHAEAEARTRPAPPLRCYP